MRSPTTERFREALAALPEHVQRQARDAYRMFVRVPFHPSLRFRQGHPARPIYSARISRDYRALGVRDGDEITWCWIGSHADYDTLLRHL